jgi:oligopeptide transport system ATP-binding protein
MSQRRSPILSIENLSVSINTPKRIVYPVNNASIDFYPGETVAIVGESGSGKTVLTQSLLRLLPSQNTSYSGKIHFHGHDLITASPSIIRDIRGKDISMIFQDPLSSLNPVLTVGTQIIENIFQHTTMDYNDAYKHTLELMSRVGMSSPETRFRQYPHELSGGLRQRVLIAIAISCKPSILIADEPTTALDVTIQAQIIALLTTLQKEENTTIVIISHDLAVVAGIADRIAVMYGGEIVELNTVNNIFEQPRHPYTQALLSTIPNIAHTRRKNLKPIPGQIPTPIKNPNQCIFADRCQYTMLACTQSHPPKYGSMSRYSRCFLHHRAAKKSWKRFASQYPSYKRIVS